MKTSFINKSAIVFVCPLCVLLSSCYSMLSINKTQLIKPPILFGEQEKILNAPRDSVDQNISLEYLATGEN